MPDFAANLSTMFAELPLPERFAAAARHGFDAVELTSIADAPPPEIARALHDNHLTLVACSLPLGSAAGAVACDPERWPQFRDAARRGIDEVAALGSRFVLCRAAMPAGTSRDRAECALIENLRFAAEIAMSAGMRLLLEAVDTQSLPGAYPHCTLQAVRILEAVRARGLALCYDVWHMHTMGEPVGETIARHLPRIGHIQIAVSPGRGEPVNGDIDFDRLLEWIDQIGHHGWVGCEYHPASNTSAGLDWLARHRRLTRVRHPVWSIPRPALEETSLRCCITDAC